MILALLVTQLVAVPCSIVFGRLARRFGSINMITVAIGIYIVICLVGFYMGSLVESGSPGGVATATRLFWAMAVLVGTSQGGIQALFGVAVLVEVGRRAWFGAEPLASVMAIAAAVALVGNLVCFALLTRFRSDDMNMRSVWLCSRNDLVNNLGVIAAAGLVAWLDTAWPDLVIGALVAALFLRTATHVLAGAWRDWQQGDDSVGAESACNSLPRSV